MDKHQKHRYVYIYIYIYPYLYIHIDTYVLACMNKHTDSKTYRRIHVLHTHTNIDGYRYTPRQL